MSQGFSQKSCILMYRTFLIYRVAFSYKYVSHIQGLSYTGGRGVAPAKVKKGFKIVKNN